MRKLNDDEELINVGQIKKSSQQNIITIIVLLFNDYLYIIKGDAPFSRRGGDYKNRTSGGIFNINSHNGEGFSSYKSMSC